MEIHQILWGELPWAKIKTISCSFILALDSILSNLKQGLASLASVISHFISHKSQHFMPTAKLQFLIRNPILDQNIYLKTKYADRRHFLATGMTSDILLHSNTFTCVYLCVCLFMQTKPRPKPKFRFFYHHQTSFLNFIFGLTKLKYTLNIR